MLVVRSDNILATLTIYPQASSNYFLKVGAGGAFIDTDIHQDDAFASTWKQNVVDVTLGITFH